MSNRFSLGKTLISANAEKELKRDDVILALSVHAEGDWVNMSPESRQINELAIRHFTRILSSHKDRHGVEFCIVTEGDRSKTSIILPEEL